MHQKIFSLLALTALFNTATAASIDDAGPTLTFRKTADGLVVDAVRQYAGQNQRDTTGLISGTTSLGSQMIEIRFQGCGEVKFIVQNTERLDGIDASRSTSPQCKIANWDIHWTVLHVDS